MGHRDAYGRKAVVPFEPFLCATSDGSISGSYTPFDGWQHCTIYLWSDDTASSDFTATLDQAKDKSGTSTKTLELTEAVATGKGGNFVTAPTVASNSMSSSATAENEIYIIEVDSADLDVDGDFDHLRVHVESLLTAATYAGLMVFSGGRYQGFDANQSPRTTIDPTTALD